MGRIRDPPKGTAFPYPDGFKRQGTVIKATKPEVIQGEHGDYAVRVELIEWEGGKKAIRFAYYRRDRGGGDSDWNWGSQTTWTFSPSITTRQIEQAKSMGFFD